MSVGNFFNDGGIGANITLPHKQSVIALLPAAFAAVIVTLAWWPAVFGVDFSLLEHYRASAVVAL